MILRKEHFIFRCNWADALINTNTVTASSRPTPAQARQKSQRCEDEIVTAC